MKKGFSLTEIVIVIAIISMLAALSVVSYSNLNSEQAVQKDAALVLSILNQARSETLSSRNNLQYGVHLASDAVTLFVGDNYSSSTSTNLVYSLNKAVALSVSLSGGGSDVVFKRLTGETDQSGTVTIALKSSATSTKSLTIYKTGLVQAN